MNKYLIPTVFSIVMLSHYSIAMEQPFGGQKRKGDFEEVTEVKKQKTDDSLSLIESFEPYVQFWNDLHQPRSLKTQTIKRICGRIGAIIGYLENFDFLKNTNNENQISDDIRKNLLLFLKKDINPFRSDLVIEFAESLINDSIKIPLDLWPFIIRNIQITRGFKSAELLIQAINVVIPNGLIDKEEIIKYCKVSKSEETILSLLQRLHGFRIDTDSIYEQFKLLEQIDCLTPELIIHCIDENSIKALLRDAKRLIYNLIFQPELVVDHREIEVFKALCFLVLKSEYFATYISYLIDKEFIRNIDSSFINAFQQYMLTINQDIPGFIDNSILPKLDILQSVFDFDLNQIMNDPQEYIVPFSQTIYQGLLLVRLHAGFLFDETYWQKMKNAGNDSKFIETMKNNVNTNNDENLFSDNHSESRRVMFLKIIDMLEKNINSIENKQDKAKTLELLIMYKKFILFISEHSNFIFEMYRNIAR